MLGYLFFHRAAPGVDRQEYESDLRKFHVALAGSGLDSFLGSRSYRLGDGYCDWYMVSSSAVLDALNELAVSGARAGSHAAVAGHAVDGAGKLLSLVSGRPSPEGTYEIRFSKPRGMAYAELYERLRQVTEKADASLWRRMMTLGPPPEFCILSDAPIDLPAEMKPETLAREEV